jgi:hypothetical protein
MLSANIEKPTCPPRCHLWWGNPQAIVYDDHDNDDDGWWQRWVFMVFIVAAAAHKLWLRFSEKLNVYHTSLQKLSRRSRWPLALRKRRAGSKHVSASAQRCNMFSFKILSVGKEKATRHFAQAQEPQTRNQKPSVGSRSKRRRLIKTSNLKPQTFCCHCLYIYIYSYGFLRNWEGIGGATAFADQ